MSDETLTQFESGTDLNQALRFHARARRRSLAGLDRMFRSHRFAIPTSTIAAGSFPARTTVVTFQTAIRINGVTPTGLLFEIGNGVTAAAAWINNTSIAFRAGGSLVADRALATFNNGGSLPISLELDLVFAVRPGDGRVRIWANGTEIARDTATGAGFPAGWAADSAGSFASAANGALPADVLQIGVPVNFAAIQPLSVYTGQAPRHFV